MGQKLVHWTGRLLPLLLVPPGILLVARGGGGAAELVLGALAASALGVLLNLLLRSLATLTGQLEQPPPAPDQRLRDLEREKQLLLRSIRELEFDAGLQRLEAEQAAELAAPLRQRALRVLQELDVARLGQAPPRLEQQIEFEVKRRRAGGPAALVLLALSALGQPAGAQGTGGALPADMFGQPLPSADLAAGELTVRVIGAELSQPQPGQTVELYRSSATGFERVGTARSGSDGRARFAGLVAGTPHRALLRQGDQAIPSRAFTLTGTGGIKLLLSTRSPTQPLAAALARDDDTGERGAAAPPSPGAAAAATSPHGNPHAGVPGAPAVPSQGVATGAATLAPAPGIAADRVEVLVLRGTARQPLAGAKVTLSATGRADETRPSDAAGRALFRLPPAARSAPPPAAAAATPPDDPAADSLTLRVEHDGHGYHSAPLRAAQTGGQRATFVVYDRTTGREGLQLAPGTHLLAQLDEGRLLCTQILLLLNPGPRIVDLGAAGLRLPLPRGATNAELSEATQAVASLSADGATLVVRGPLPPGQLELQVSYALPYDGSLLEFQQQLPLGSARSLIAIGGAPAVDVAGPALDGHEVRQHQGVTMELFSLAPLARGRTLELTLRNLPHRASWPRELVLGLTVLIALWATAGILQGRRHAARRAAQRDRLLDRLATLEAQHATGQVESGRYARERAALLADVRQVWDAEARPTLTSPLT